MSVSLTESAAMHIKECIEKRQKNTVGIRFGVKASGCTGFAYVAEYANEVSDNDLKFESQGVCVIVDKKSIIHLDNMEVDFVKDKLQSGLKFNNPNITHSCGCGESFTT